MTSISATLVHPLFKEHIFNLRHKDSEEEARLCDACGTRVDAWYYHCAKKGLDLHPGCAKLPMKIKHEDLTFELRRKATHRCNICGGRGGKMTFWYYRSTCRTVYMHVRCVKKQLVTCSSDPAAGGGGGSASSSTTPADNKTTMTSFVQAALQGYTGNKYERTCEMVAAVVRVIVGFISGDTAEIITATVGLISSYSAGR